MTVNPIQKGTETLDDLILGGMHLIQAKQGYRVSFDAIVLAHFVNLHKVQTVVDIGTGNGIIPLLISQRAPEVHILGVEIQESMASRAVRNTIHNHKEHQIEIIQEDIRQIEQRLPGGLAQLVVSNPPFWKQGEGKVSVNEEESIARHELSLNMEQLVDKASYLLENRGRLAVIQRADRLEEVMHCFTEHGFQLKRLRLIHSYADREAKLLLLEGQKNAGGKLTILPPLIIYERQGEYCEEIRRLYQAEV